MVILAVVPVMLFLKSRDTSKDTTVISVIEVFQ